MIFVTGAKGRVGSAILDRLRTHVPVRAGAREPCPDDEHVEWLPFAFERRETFGRCLTGVSAVFLMRPPQIVRPSAFRAFLAAMQERGIRRLVLLSVKGADRNPLLPHYSIERLVQREGFDWTILRPSDFMQNFETVHRQSIRRGEIAVPAGGGRSAFVDVADIGEIGAKVLLEGGHERRGYTLTGPEALSFDEVARCFGLILGRRVSYRREPILSFVHAQVASGNPLAMAIVMAGLYTIQRLGWADGVTEDARLLLGRAPTTLRDYILRRRHVWDRPLKDQAVSRTC